LSVEHDIPYRKLIFFHCAFKPTDCFGPDSPEGLNKGCCSVPQLDAFAILVGRLLETDELMS
jgi:hypothetical protein